MGQHRRVIQRIYQPPVKNSQSAFRKNPLNALQTQGSGLVMPSLRDGSERFSFISYVKSEFTFSKESLNTYFKSLQSDPTSPEYAIKNLYDDFVLAIGIWTEDSGIYQFSHRSLQEYFAAAYLRNLDEPHKNQIYEHLRKQTVESQREIMSFMNLCEEQDEQNYIIKYKIPILEQIQKNLRLNGNYKDEMIVCGGLIKVLCYGKAPKNRKSGLVLMAISGPIFPYIDYFLPECSNKIVNWAVNLNEHWEKYLNEIKPRDESDFPDNFEICINFENRIDDTEMYDHIKNHTEVGVLGRWVIEQVDLKLTAAKSRLSNLEKSIVTVLDFIS